ncbi:MAG: hypothetical protein DPW21_00170 [Anaerolineae bacterium]|nr:hypothetical protein [Chloroflexi bacterium CFX2]MCQ3945096.1 hypothetical protein [Anaerolineae bacterium]MCZ7550868.1 hypothetical protein [Anaerolineales bacterium]GER79224.1 conserved hypothetical protein [Candidatus Denitrolinea symbiosum]
MKQILYASSILLFVITAIFANPVPVSASEGDGGDGLEMEVNGYHVTLDSQNEWVKGENILVVTVTDSMGMPLSDVDVEILVAPKADGHDETETDSHDSAPQDSMSGMDMGGEPTQETGVMRPNNPSDAPAHDEESANPIAMTESEHGMYIVQTHLEATGEHDVHVMFHVDGEMLQADFVVKVTGSNSKNIVLWSFAAVNVALVAAAGVLKKQKSITVKGGK